MITTLIVDDHADIRMLLRMVIEAAADHDLVVSGEAGSGQEALDRLDDVDPSIVLLDEMMPGLSGIETARLIRQRRPHQRIVMCSARTEEAFRQAAEDAGIDAVLPKDRLDEVPSVLRAVARGERFT